MKLPLIVCALTWSLSAVAQEPADTLAELQRQIYVLADEIEQLKRGAPAPERPWQERGLGPAASRVYSSHGGVSLASYGEALYQNFSSVDQSGEPSGRKDQIDYLRAVLYVGYTFNDWILFNSEIEFEHASTSNGGSVAVELAYLELTIARAANLRTGLLLVPVGIVNEKHEPTTYFGTERPLAEQVVIPSTWRALGAGFYGEITPWLNYRGYIVEGLDASGFSSSSGVRPGRQNGSRAIAEHFAVTGKLEANLFPGSLVGGSFFAGKSGQGMADSLGTLDAATLIVSAHSEIVWERVELRALYARTTVGQADRLSALLGTTVGSRMEGWYISAGYDLMPLLSQSSLHYLAPYVQYEKVNTHTRVAPGSVRDPANDIALWTAGLMYKPDPSVAFKADYRQLKNNARTGVSQWNLAVSYLF